MISASLHQIFHPDRGFLHIRIWSEGFAAGQPPPPVRKDFEWLHPADAGHAWSEDHIKRFLATAPSSIDRDGIVIVPAPVCACCGTHFPPYGGGGQRLALTRPDRDPAQRQYRCAKHRNRNPCAVEGCKRTGPASSGHHRDDLHLCGTHYRIAAPPGSRERKAINRLWRLRKKRCWSSDLSARYWRLWPRLVRLARSRTAGDIDMAEINKMFGWDV